MSAIRIIGPGRSIADLPALRAWIDAEPGRECRIVCRGAVWWVELFTRDECRASVGHADPRVALAKALEQAGE